jgi:hypothetical protein
MKHRSLRRQYRDPGLSFVQNLRQALVVNSLFRSIWLRRKIKELGDIADFVSFVQKQFKTKQKPVFSREHLWTSILKEIGNDPFRGIEFGVAWGYCTAWWLTNSQASDSSRNLTKWDGFDRFTGLPNEWRGLPSGYFSNHGHPPDLKDERLTWHIGDVEDTIRHLNLDRKLGERLVIIFDLDLFEPSLVCWDAIKDHLRTGDVLYFDEAFDQDERLLLVDHVLIHSNYSLIGYSTIALAIVKR